MASSAGTVSPPEKPVLLLMLFSPPPPLLLAPLPTWWLSLVTLTLGGFTAFSPRSLPWLPGPHFQRSQQSLLWTSSFSLLVSFTISALPQSLSISSTFLPHASHTSYSSRPESGTTSLYHLSPLPQVCRDLVQLCISEISKQQKLKHEDSFPHIK
jgi:hypothetical protein